MHLFHDKKTLSKVFNTMMFIIVGNVWGSNEEKVIKWTVEDSNLRDPFGMPDLQSGAIAALPTVQQWSRRVQSANVATSTALIVCSLFSAWSKTIEAGDSNTSSSTSIPSNP